jgi:DNA-binding transcriptional LysR family regulator
MAQPPLSQSIKRLEDELGVRLLERSRSGVSLTHAGSVFLDEARRTLMQADLTREVTLRAAKTGANVVSVSFIGPPMFQLLPPILAAHHNRHPDIVIKLSSLSSNEQMIGIMEGRIDVAFLHPSIDLIEGADSIIVERCGFVAGIPEDWPLARQETVTLAELAEHPLIMPPEHEAPSRVSAMLNAFRDVGASPRVVQEAMQTHILVSLVASGLGASLIVETATLLGARGVVYRPISDLPSNVRWETAMVWHPNHISRGAQLFMEEVKAYCTEHADRLGSDPARWSSRA